jgi:hypothetical protein
VLLHFKDDNGKDRWISANHVIEAREHAKGKIELHLAPDGRIIRLAGGGDQIPDEVVSAINRATALVVR